MKSDLRVCAKIFFKKRGGDARSEDHTFKIIPGTQVPVKEQHRQSHKKSAFISLLSVSLLLKTNLKLSNRCLMIVESCLLNINLRLLSIDFFLLCIICFS